MLELARGVEGVGVDHGHAGAQRAVHHDGILQDVRHHDGDPVALLQSAAGLQERAELRRHHVDLAVGDRLAHLHVGIAHRMNGERPLDHLLERRVLVDIDLSPNARWI